MLILERKKDTDEARAAIADMGNETVRSFPMAIDDGHIVGLPQLFESNSRKSTRIIDDDSGRTSKTNSTHAPIHRRSQVASSSRD
jgi:hypothetical protein